MFASKASIASRPAVAKSAKAPRTARVATVASSGGYRANQAVKGGAPNTGLSKTMEKKTWLDSSGRKGKGYGVYRYDKKYGANVDGYSPIYTPNEWSSKGDTYAGGENGLKIWFAGLSTLLLTGAFAIYATSAIGQ
jgi:photosystem II protein